MPLVAPVFEGLFDATDPADAVRFRKMVEELKVTVKTAGLTTGILLHKWIDATHLKVIVFDSTLEGRGAAEAMVAQEGFEVGPLQGRPKEGLSDVVERVKQRTAQLDPRKLP